MNNVVSRILKVTTVIAAIAFGLLLLVSCIVLMQIGAEAEMSMPSMSEDPYSNSLITNNVTEEVNQNEFD